jgi:3-phenylpropionate/trans-cinnamate dioxygenase ferredoxin reductase component
MSGLRQVVVVGAAAAGLTAAETLRREGFSGRITMVGAESHPPYDRPPLSKQVLSGAWDPERTMLRQRPVLDELGAEWRFGVPAAGLDLDAHEVVLSDDSRLGYDGLVVATGGGRRRRSKLGALRSRQADPRGAPDERHRAGHGGCADAVGQS